MRTFPWMLSASALALGAVIACTEVEPQAGQEGGVCRVSTTPCDPGLVCRDKGCRVPDGDDPVEVDVIWSYPLERGKNRVEADGVDFTIVQATLVDRATGAPMPEGFRFRMWLDQPGTGDLRVLDEFNPRSPDLQWRLADAEGRGVARFVSCDKEAPGCFRYAQVHIAVEPRPIFPLESVILENIGAPLPGGGAGGEGGGGGVGGAGGAGGTGGGFDGEVNADVADWADCRATPNFTHAESSNGAVFDLDIESWSARVDNPDFPSRVEVFAQVGQDSEFRVTLAAPPSEELRRGSYLAGEGGATIALGFTGETQAIDPCDGGSQPRGAAFTIREMVRQEGAVVVDSMELTYTVGCDELLKGCFNLE